MSVDDNQKRDEMPRFRLNPVFVCLLILVTIGVVDAKERSGKGSRFAKGHQQSLVDLSLWVNEDSTEQ